MEGEHKVGPQEPPEARGVEELAKECLDSPGYLFFTAQLTSKRDAKDRAIIDFDYRRYHFAI